MTDVLNFRYGADPFDSWNQTTPGPLTVLMNAMLGNESWFYPIVNATSVEESRDAFVSTCLRGLPFSTYTGYVHNGFATTNLECSFLNYPGKVPNVDLDVSRMIAGWFSGFSYNTSTEDALEAGMFLASEALMSLTADASKIDSARPIYVSSGTSVIKPIMRNPPKAIVSFLMLVEVVGLLFLAWFSYRMPTFAPRLDAVHIATIGSQLTTQMGVDLPPLSLRPRGPQRRKYLNKLEESDGLIGVQEDIELTRLTRSSAMSPRTSTILTPGPGTNHPPSTHPGLAEFSPTSSLHASRHRLSGSHGIVSFPPRSVHGNSSYASSSHTNDDVISALDAVSEINDPDGPPKYGDIMQADAERESVVAAATQGMKLFVGGSGRITREMAKTPSRPRARRTVSTIPRPGRRQNPSDSQDRSSRISVIRAQENAPSSRTA